MSIERCAHCEEFADIDYDEGEYVGMMFYHHHCLEKLLWEPFYMAAKGNHERITETP